MAFRGHEDGLRTRPDAQRATQATGTLLSPRDLAKSHPVAGGQPVHVLAPLSFDVAHGEFDAIVGPSTAGRTTLLKIIAGLVEPAAGSASASSTRRARSACRRLTRGSRHRQPSATC